MRNLINIILFISTKNLQKNMLENYWSLLTENLSFQKLMRKVKFN